MFDAEIQGATAMISPDEVFLDPHNRCAERIFAKATKDPNESRRRLLMNVAAGRIVWACVVPPEKRQLGERSTWRGITHRELRESLQADVEAFRQAEADHKAAATALSKRQSRGLLGRKPAPADFIVGSPSYRNVPMITFTDAQLVRGLQLLVERGYLRKEGDGDDATYFVDAHFFKDLKVSPLPPEIHEP